MCYYFISILQAFYNEKILVVLIKIAKAKRNFKELGQTCWHTSDRQRRCKTLIWLQRLEQARTHTWSPVDFLGFCTQDTGFPWKSDIALQGPGQPAWAHFSLYLNTGVLALQVGLYSVGLYLALSNLQCANLVQAGFWTKCSLFAVAEALALPERLLVPDG